MMRAAASPECPESIAKEFIKSQPISSVWLTALEAPEQARRSNMPEVSANAPYSDEFLFQAASGALVMHRVVAMSNRTRAHAVAQQLWHHSAYVAALTYVIARDISDAGPALAMLAGLRYG